MASLNGLSTASLWQCCSLLVMFEMWKMRLTDNYLVESFFQLLGIPFQHITLQSQLSSAFDEIRYLMT